MVGMVTIASRLPMASSVWKGTLVLSLLSIPVRLYAAARSGRTYHRRGQREKGLSAIDESLGRHRDRRHRHAADAPAGLHGFPSPLSARSAAAHHVFRQ